MYVSQRSGIYVVIAAQVYPNGIYYHCAGAAVSPQNAVRYAENYESYYREHGYEMVDVEDMLDKSGSYESIWENEFGNMAYLKIQKSAIMD